MWLPLSQPIFYLLRLLNKQQLCEACVCSLLFFKKQLVTTHSLIFTFSSCFISRSSVELVSAACFYLNDSFLQSLQITTCFFYLPELIHKQLLCRAYISSLLLCFLKLHNTVWYFTFCSCSISSRSVEFVSADCFSF